jgi:hypothetical protein
VLKFIPQTGYSNFAPAIRKLSASTAALIVKANTNSYQKGAYKELDFAAPAYDVALPITPSPPDLARWLLVPFSNPIEQAAQFDQSLAASTNRQIALHVVMEHADARTTASGTSNGGAGLCLLSLDGGGIRGISSLLILQRFMEMITL